jgi:hypothetical protein
MQIPLERCKGAGDPPRQCRGRADSSGIADDSDPSQQPNEETDPFKMAGMQIPVGLHRLMTPTGPLREDVPSEVV